MGLLDKLWDDTLAGPQPDKGLGRLRKPTPLSFRSYSGKGGFWTAEDEMGDGGISKDFGYDSPENTPRVTRSIMIKRPSGCSLPTPPQSPAGSAPLISPLSGGKEWNRFRRISSSDAYPGTVGGGSAKSPSSPYQV
ncbi:dormancy-associated protein homolog 3-like [Phalaenopsis equestris]|uniref:dormancy-associated protein homolog 3-like n=1 Tax=Phalaenopsis equestris TaxID=78828 RepID=UPI0009E5542E|nr:dormancy-associated protein homolog 3-like [Phalaenopsis equestris]